MQFLQFFFNESQVKYSKKGISKRKKSVNDFFIAVLIMFYYLKSNKIRLSNQNSGMVPEVTLFQNSKINIVIKFRVSI